MTPPSVRLFASREAITGDSRAIPRRQLRRFCTSPRSPSRRYGCCSEATPTQQLRRALLIRSSQIGTGRISASQLTIRPTRHPSKNSVNPSRTIVLKASRYIWESTSIQAAATSLFHFGNGGRREVHADSNHAGGESVSVCRKSDYQNSPSGLVIGRPSLSSPRNCPESSRVHG